MSAPPPLRCRLVRPEDDAALAAIIRTVMPEFGASGPGFAINDPEVDYMSRAYDRRGAAYFVIEDVHGTVLGGGGIAPLDGADPAVCELRKMYFLRAARGAGMGAALLGHLLDQARELGYRRCYLETLAGMERAIQLYERFGFQHLAAPLGATGHFGCNRYFALDL